MTRNTGDVWIPEAPATSAGVFSTPCYANFDGCKPVSTPPGTLDVYKSLQFETEAECAAWCAEHPHPVFVPVAHSFAP